MLRLGHALVLSRETATINWRAPQLACPLAVAVEDPDSPTCQVESPSLSLCEYPDSPHTLHVSEALTWLLPASTPSPMDE